jgi:hypothetical protein
MATVLEKRQLVEEIKGIRRVVINNCHGGFGLSHKAVLRYLELIGKQVWHEDDPMVKSIELKTYWLIPPDADRVPSQPDNWYDMTIAERQAHNKKYSEQTFSPRDIARDDPYLVKVVQEMGNKAAGKYSELKVVDIPSDVEYTIEEYDGAEWIAEKHRTWK